MSKDSIQDSVTNIRNILIEMDADSAADLIADIMHYCEAEKESFPYNVRRGTMYYNDELEDAQQEEQFQNNLDNLGK
jgi:hypothetical protein